jgi:hypothetical protein
MPKKKIKKQKKIESFEEFCIVEDGLDGGPNVKRVGGPAICSCDNEEDAQMIVDALNKKDK